MWGGRSESVGSGRHPTARIFSRNWFAYKVIKKGDIFKDLGAGFERVKNNFSDGTRDGLWPREKGHS
jgi:hypothetical protein